MNYEQCVHTGIERGMEKVALPKWQKVMQGKSREGAAEMGKKMLKSDMSVGGRPADADMVFSALSHYGTGSKKDIIRSVKGSIKHHKERVNKLKSRPITDSERKREAFTRRNVRASGRSYPPAKGDFFGHWRPPVESYKNVIGDKRGKKLFDAVSTRGDKDYMRARRRSKASFVPKKVREARWAQRNAEVAEYESLMRKIKGK